MNILKCVCGAVHASPHCPKCGFTPLRSATHHILQTDSEHDEQAKLIQETELLKQKYPEIDLLFAIPNGEHRHISVAKRLKYEGVKPGVPDLFLPVCRGGYPGLFIEMKRKHGGRLTEDQKKWRDGLRAQGYQWHRCDGCADALNVIIEYLEMNTLNGIMGEK